MPPVNILILGAGVYAEEVADLLADCGGYQLRGFIDEFVSEADGITKLGLPVLNLQQAAAMKETHLVISGVGGRKRVPFIRRVMALGFTFCSLAHPSASISRSAVLGIGSAIRAGCVVAANVVIGQHVVINRGCLIGHDVEIGDFALLGPGVNIAGKTVIGAGTEIGMGAIITEHRTVGRFAVVGAGALVNRDVPDLVQVVGMPAQVIRKLDEPE